MIVKDVPVDGNDGPFIRNLGNSQRATLRFLACYVRDPQINPCQTPTPEFQSSKTAILLLVLSSCRSTALVSEALSFALRGASPSWAIFAPGQMTKLKPKPVSTNQSVCGWGPFGPWELGEDLA